ncbi:hypothetical protein AAMO2058_001256000 [Amorphochlora amoebiformis]
MDVSYMTYYEDVKNASKLSEDVKNSGEVDYVLVDAQYVVDGFQIAVAVNRAIESQKIHLMDTKSLPTEVLYNLSPSTNISGGLKKHGVSPDTTRIVLVAFKPPSKRVLSIVEGQLISSLEGLRKKADEKILQKYYKIPDLELKIGTLLDAIVTRLAAKEPMKGLFSTKEVSSNTSSKTPQNGKPAKKPRSNNRRRKRN